MKAKHIENLRQRLDKYDILIYTRYFKGELVSLSKANIPVIHVGMVKYALLEESVTSNSVFNLD